MNINEKLKLIQVQFKAPKDKFNSFGKYKFRSAESILEAIKPFLDEHNVTVRIEEEFIDGTVPVIKSKAIISDGTDEISAQAIVGVDLNQKGMQVPQQFGSASSYGKKYALGNLLLIDDTQDSDATNDHGQSKQKLSGVALEKAKEYIKGGGSIDAIKSKYDVSAAVEKQLQTL